MFVINCCLQHVGWCVTNYVCNCVFKCISILGYCFINLLFYPSPQKGITRHEIWAAGRPTIRATPSYPFCSKMLMKPIYGAGLNLSWDQGPHECHVLFSTNVVPRPLIATPQTWRNSNSVFHTQNGMHLTCETEKEVKLLDLQFHCLLNHVFVTKKQKSYNILKIGSHISYTLHITILFWEQPNVVWTYFIYYLVT